MQEKASKMEFWKVNNTFVHIKGYPLQTDLEY